MDNSQITTKPTQEDEKFGWAMNVNLLGQIKQVLEYPAHDLAIEQIIVILRENNLLNEGEL